MTKHRHSPSPIRRPTQIIGRYQKARGLGDAQMAEALGLNRQTIWNWRSGNTEPSEHELLRIIDESGPADWRCQMAMEIVQCQVAARRARLEAAVAA